MSEEEQDQLRKLNERLDRIEGKLNRALAPVRTISFERLNEWMDKNAGWMDNRTRF